MQAPENSRSLISHADRVRIIGQGLSGSLLALMLREKGVPFVVQDSFIPGEATSVAPGIVNPLAGRHFRPPEHVKLLLEEVQAAMDLVEKHLEVSLWKPCPILRMFAEPAQLDRFKMTDDQPENRAFVGERFPENTFSYLNDVFGSFITERGGWANLPLLKERMRAWLKKENRLIEEVWTPSSDEGQQSSEALCFCEGWQVANNPHWSFIPHNPAKGEMLVVRFEEELPRDRIYSQSCWVQPIEDDLWRVGATYSWSNFNSEPSPEGSKDLLERLRLLTPSPIQIVDQIAGVRPIVEDYRPVIGQHPDKKNWFILNALGSKGVLQAATAAKALVTFMTEDKGMFPEWSVNRFL